MSSNVPTVPPSRGPALCLLLMLGAALAGGEAPKEPPKDKHPWLREMQFGPYICDTISAPGGNIAIKGTAVRLAAGERQGGMLFDADLMRMAAGWEGGFLTLTGDAYDGQHNPGPSTAGTEVFATPAVPGWARAGSFADPRSEPFGPLPADWARFKGLYLHGDRVVVAYSVGAGEVLELPGLEADGAAVSRTLAIDGSAAATMLVAELAEGAGAVAGGIAHLAAGARRVSAGLVGAPKGAALAVAGNRILLQLPALRQATFKVVLTGAAPDAVAMIMTGAATITDPRTLVAGGPPRWAETVTTAGKLGDGAGPYTVDTLSAPDRNPYKSRLRFGGFGFFSDGRAAISTWNGDVWIVDGIDTDLDQLVWRRFATGLHQPLGLTVVDDTVYALCRSGLVRLKDLDRDGEADLVENVNNQVHATSAFHEFAFDLWTDAKGDFYFIKAGPVKKGGRGWEQIAAHHGSLLRITRDGSRLETVATGFRAPNGMSVGPKGEFTSGDNEGTWTPTSRLNLIRPGGFYGVPDLAHRTPAPTTYDPPICWMSHRVENSCGGQAWVLGDKWGPLEGSLLHLSYGKCSLYLVAWSQEGDVPQGGITRFPLDFRTGIMRARFNPKDGQLYVCGLKGWQTTAGSDGAFQRVRYTGKPVHMPKVMQAWGKGLSLTFTSPLDPASVADIGNWSVEQWNYQWTGAYGSPEMKPSDPTAKGHDPLPVASATLSADGKTVFLEMPGIQPVMQMHIKYRIAAADGTPVHSEFHGTINKLGAKARP